MKFNFKQWGERVRAWLEKLRRRPGGAAAIPGEMNTVRSGKLKLPLIDWEKLYRKSFLYNSLAAVVCGYFMAELLVAGLTPWFPPAEPPRPRLDLASSKKSFDVYASVLLPPKGKPNLFSEKGLIPDNDEGGTGIDGGPPVKTSLPLTLLGLIKTQDGSKSVASVEDKSINQVLAVREGYPLAHECIVEKIEDDRVIFINNGTRRREFIELPQDQILTTRKSAPSKPGGIQKSSENRYVIPRTDVDKAMENLNEILTEARCVPEFQGGKPAGYRCFQIVPGSIYDKLGLKDNDVICGIDGESVNDPAKAFSKLSALKDASTRSISICINRGGKISNVQYDIN